MSTWLFRLAMVKDTFEHVQDQEGRVHVADVCMTERNLEAVSKLRI